MFGIRQNPSRGSNLMPICRVPPTVWMNIQNIQVITKQLEEIRKE